MDIKSKERWYQKREREKNKELILEQLHAGPKRNKDLLEQTSLSHTTLSNILKELLAANKIQRVVHNNHEAYAIGKKSGITYGWWLLSRPITEIWERKGKVSRADAGFQFDMDEMKMPWGISIVSAVDREVADLNPISEDDAEELGKAIFTRSFDKIKKGKIAIDKDKKGKIALVITIDYPELIKSIEQNSLKKYQEAISK